MGKKGTSVRYLGTTKAAEALGVSPSGLWRLRKNTEGRYRQAAEAGDVDAAVVLGVLLHAHGDLTGAETWLARAASAGHPDATIGLGFLCHRIGRTSDAHHWYRQAAEAGDVDAAVVLGVLLHAHGDLTGAETWLARAASAGHPDAEGVLDDAEGAWRLPYRFGRIQTAPHSNLPGDMPPLPAVVIHEPKQGHSGWRTQDLKRRGDPAAIRLAQPETLVGLSAVAALLDRHKERVRALSRTEEFPAAEAELQEPTRVRPGWRIDRIQVYAQDRNTKPGQAGWRSRRQPTPTPAS